LGDRKKQALVFAGIFAFGFLVLYLPLTIICARADGARWKLYPTEGECWSEGGSAPGADLGLLAGAVMGFGLAGLLVVAVQPFCLATFCPQRKILDNEHTTSFTELQNQQEQQQGTIV